MRSAGEHTRRRAQGTATRGVAASWDTVVSCILMRPPTSVVRIWVSRHRRLYPNNDITRARAVKAVGETMSAGVAVLGEVSGMKGTYIVTVLEATENIVMRSGWRVLSEI